MSSSLPYLSYTTLQILYCYLNRRIGTLVVIPWVLFSLNLTALLKGSRSFCEYYIYQNDLDKNSLKIGMNLY